MQTLSVGAGARAEREFQDAPRLQRLEGGTRRALCTQPEKESGPTARMLAMTQAS